MKISLLPFIFFFILTGFSFGQDCLPEGIYLKSQQDVDQFAANNPGCTTILGTLSIYENDATPITNLTGLSQITAVGGNLSISHNDQLSSLQGLHNIVSVGAYLLITGNPMLTTLEGLNSIESVAITARIQSNFALQTLNGLNNLQTVEEDFEISGNTVLTDLEGLTKLRMVNGQLEVFFNQAMKTLGLVPELEYVYDFVIGANEDLEDLGDFPKLQTVGNNFEIFENNSLKSFEGLDELTTVNLHFSVFFNPVLTCSGLGKLVYIGEDLAIDYNAGILDLSCLNDNLVIDHNIAIVDNALLAICDAPVICAFVAAHPGIVLIRDNAPGCNSVEEVLTACSASSVLETLSRRVKLFPNPAINTLRLSTDLTLNQDYRITNVNGQLLRSGDLVNRSIELNGLSDGLYFIHLNSDEGIVVLKFVKQSE